ncbi:hypothetical protein DFH94DRAFT_687643 [Russula ochroleuca]|jgi:hypothetical protein|uniref:Uncharacterized protein n=1 Tax=Russula ochroleuca TaxID=152965 RepID=A0A9P5N5Z0_9AGAM|nr:hypothetical protein DFH94DRAFT_687643 [Russula ochroleuca]
MSHRNDTTYDRSLLSSIPKPTRAEKQEGYNIDLLDEGRDRAATTAQEVQTGATDGYSPGAIGLARKEGQLENGDHVAKKAPWYRTRWGMITIVIIIILIIGGAVGGAVGGTHHSNSHSGSNGGDNTGRPNTTSTTIGGSQNAGTQISALAPSSSLTTTGPTPTPAPTNSLAGSPNLNATAHT